jgi:hypothetical protein
MCPANGSCGRALRQGILSLAVTLTVSQPQGSDRPDSPAKGGVLIIGCREFLDAGAVAGSAPMPQTLNHGRSPLSRVAYDAQGVWGCDTRTERSSPWVRSSLPGVHGVRVRRPGSLRSHLPALRGRWLCPRRGAERQRTAAGGRELDLYYVLSTWNPDVVVLMSSHLQVAPSGRSTVSQVGSASH